MRGIHLSPVLYSLPVSTSSASAAGVLCAKLRTLQPIPLRPHPHIAAAYLPPCP
jgi:hypothetical protein